MRNLSANNELHRRIGGIEAQVEVLKEKSDSHTDKIQALEIANTKILAELEKSNSALTRIEGALEVVDKINDISSALSLVGTFMEKFVKYSKAILICAVILYATFMYLKSGDFASAVSTIMQLGGIN